MAQLIVRRIPDDVMDEVRTAAQAEGVSVEEFARRILRDQADRRNRWREFVEWSRNFTAQQQPQPKGMLKLIRHDRRPN